jgi:hypothetical protein
VYPITLAWNWVATARYRDSEDVNPPAGCTPLEDAEDGFTKKASNLTSKGNTDLIPWKTAHMLWFSGLRGAVSYALVKTFPQTGNENMFAVTTMMIVLITTFVFGGATEAALRFFKIETNVDEGQYLETIGKKRLLCGWFHHFEGQTLRRWVIRDFDKSKESDKKVEDDELDYQAHEVELTEHDHMRLVAAGGIFDYGQ